MDCDPSILSRLLAPLRRRIALMVRRAVIDLVNDDNPVQAMQLRLYKGEIRQGVERIQEYGFSSVPLPEGQAVAVCVDGEAGHELVIATDDRRWRPRKKNPGDVTLYTDKNAEGDAHHVYIGAADRHVNIRGNTIRLDADEDITLVCRGTINLKADGDITVIGEKKIGITAKDDLTEKGANILLN